MNMGSLNCWKILRYPRLCREIKLSKNSCRILFIINKTQFRWNKQLIWLTETKLMFRMYDYSNILYNMNPIFTSIALTVILGFITVSVNAMWMLVLFKQFIQWRQCKWKPEWNTLSRWNCSVTCYTVHTHSGKAQLTEVDQYIFGLPIIILISILEMPYTL